MIDMRLPEVKATQRGKSINLALSERGLNALRNSGLDLDQLILEAAVPLRARMVHIGKEGRQMSQAYGKKDQV
jgi:kynurenine 3-monooxygenase